MKLSDFARAELIEKGWSDDKKYHVTTHDGREYLLRLTPAEKREAKKAEFDYMQRVAETGVSMCRAHEFGEMDEYVYSLQDWISGEDAETAVPKMDVETQYRYGLDAGRALKKIHTIPAPDNAGDWEERFNKKIDRKFRIYADCPLKYPVDRPFLDYLSENRGLLKGRPQTWQHGDYHIGNMMIDDSGKLVVIDFNRSDVGDPWEEFNRIVWSAQASPAFASGTVDGYFDGNVPDDFWKLLALYFCNNTLGSLPWAIPFGQGEIDVMIKQAGEMLDWFDNMARLKPKWYCEGFYQKLSR